MAEIPNDANFDISSLARAATSRTAVATVHPIPDTIFDELPWYQWWVLRQLDLQPQRPLCCLPANHEFGEKPRSHSSEPWMLVWNHIRELVLAPGSKTIDSITDSLVEFGLVMPPDTYEGTQSVRDLVFSILGWQTMLYKPDFVSADAQVPGCFNILDEMDGYRGETRACLTQAAAYASKKPLPDFLLGFGLMLPPPNYNAFANDDDQQKLFFECKTVLPKEMNAHVLKNICGLSFRWVDSLSCHLEMDKRSGTVFLYRYPSFCAHHCRQRQAPQEIASRPSESGSKSGLKSTLHCCAFERRSSVPWADQEDVTRLLQQILLSYRLLFGQNKKSREVFRSLRPFEGVAAQGHDRCLSQLCSQKRPPKRGIELKEREEYDLIDDFPHLRSKLVRLSSYASSKKPQSFLQLWADRRNSPAWLAFWSVLIFGSIGIFLALVQTVFQILQYVDSVKHPGGN
jgi:hypothetical protein